MEINSFHNWNSNFLCHQQFKADLFANPKLQIYV